MKLYNSLTKQIEDFKPLKEKEVSIYSCGPTVYSYAHIGNLRAFLFADFLQRVLKVVGQNNIKWVMNITNIDDKTIRDSQNPETWKPEFGEITNDTHSNLNKLCSFYEAKFKKDIELLGIKNNDFFKMPRATDYIEQMKELIHRIINNGFAYEAAGSMYFNVGKWRENQTYGKLKKIDFENFKTGSRIDTDEYEREQVSDFVLWKAKKEGEPFWQFEIDGRILEGRPGWHLECSAMEFDILGLPFDIHTGGVDLKFPHHEDEIAQSKAGYGIEPTQMWCHNEFLEVEGKKMSKSIGNFYTLRDLIEKGLDPKDIRFAMLSAHYRSKYNFTFDDVEAAKKARTKIQEFVYELMSDEIGTFEINVNEFKDEVFSNLGSDLHSPKALASIFSFINLRKANFYTFNTKNELLEVFKHINDIYSAFEITKRPEETIPNNILELAEQRLKAKKDKNWVESDNLRNQIISLGYTIKDTKDSYELAKG